jgi:hypothetical protein
MSVGPEQTGAAPSALERYDPDKTTTNDAFSCVCKRRGQKRYGKARDFLANLARTEINSVRKTLRACLHIQVIRAV